jgi:hypothetical protein
MQQASFTDLLIAAVLSSAVVSTVLQLLFRALTEDRFERLKAELDLSNQQILATQQQLLSQKQTEHEWLHQKRAEVMLTISDLRLDAEDAFERFMAMISFRGDPGPDERYRLAVAAGDAYRKYYRRHKPLFPSRVAELLDGVNRNFVKIANMYRGQRALQDNEYYALADIMQKDIPQITEALDVVQEVFRRMFGVTSGT